MSHRVKSCPLTDRERADLPPTVKEEWYRGEAFVERAFIPRHEVTADIPPVGPMVYGWYKDVVLPTATGDIAVDGSGLLFPWLPELSRCGWGVVAVNGQNLLGGFYGSLEGYRQTVPRAELWAIYEALRWASRPFRIISDHKNHVEAISKGKDW